MTTPLFKIERPEAGSDDYYTPHWIFEQLGLQFDLDVAAPPGGVSWIPADHFYTMADDGLAQPWIGRVWCNPPYSNSRPWVEKMAQHGNGILLLPISPGGPTWITEAWNVADGITLLPPDMPFVRADGRDQRINYRTALWAFGDECVKAIGRLGRVR